MLIYVINMNTTFWFILDTRTYEFNKQYYEWPMEPSLLQMIIYALIYPLLIVYATLSEVLDMHNC